MKIKQQRYENKKGYTLLEIMIVVMLIGVLTSMAIISIVKVRENMRLKHAKTELEMIAAAVRQLAWDTGKWPTGLTRIDKTMEYEAWDLTKGSAGITKTDGSFNNWKGPYLSKIPIDPWGSKYFFDPDYKINGIDCVVIGSLGPNRTGRNSYNEDNLYTIIETGE